MSTSLPFFVGTYTQQITHDFGGIGDGILSFTLDTVTGEINRLHTYPCTNPSYLAISACGKFIYTINEVAEDEQPETIALKIEDDQSLVKINSQPVAGAFPCHIACLPGFLAVACYGTGNIVCYPVRETGDLGPCQFNFQHQGISINEMRQEGPHAHQIMPQPGNSMFYVPDLGIDQVKAYRITKDVVSSETSRDFVVTRGGGPRHMVFTHTGKQAFVINELTGIISGFTTGEEGVKLISEIASLPDDFSGEPSASALRIHPNGKYLYAGNRNAEGITVFYLSDDGLHLKGFVPTQGKTLREFNLSPDGNWLIAAHQDSHDLVVYRVLNEGLTLERHSDYSVDSPVCVVFKD